MPPTITRRRSAEYSDQLIAVSPAVNPADNLLERSAQLGALDGWLREAASGQGRLVLIGGEAGAGKSTLVDHFCQTAGGRARVLRGACDAM